VHDIVGPTHRDLSPPAKALLGILPPHIFAEGSIGLLSRSGTLTYVIIDEMTKNKHDQSTAIGSRGDPVIGMTSSQRSSDSKTTRTPKP
jgi:succinyl-CoA synthetase alpha subunit